MSRGLLAALFGAACVVLAFPTVGWAVPILAAWVPLLVVARRVAWRRRLLLGWVMGFAYQAVLFRWIVFTMQEMSDLPPAAAVACLLAFAAWHGLKDGLFLVLAEPARRGAAARHPGLGPPAVAVVYTAVEWLWPFLFPWFWGQAFWQVGPVSSVMALTGAPGLSFVVVTISAVAAEVLATRRWRAAVPGLVACAALLAFGVGWWWHLQSTPPRRTLRVAAVQMNYTLEEKKDADLDMRRIFLERFTERLAALEPGAYDLVIASEGAYPFYWRPDAPHYREAVGEDRLPTSVRATREVAGLVAATGADAIVGGLRRPEGGRTRNSAVLLTSEGRLADVYDKNILVPFGEYLPGREWFPDLKIKGISDFGAGERPCRLEAAGEVVACGICYESIFSGFTRWTAGAEADLLVNLTIDVWFGRSTAPWFHLMSQSSRAAELGIPLVRSALTGISAYVGPDGVPRATLGLDRAGVLEADVPLRDVTTPFRVIGPVFAWICLGLAVLVLVAGARTRNKS
ncbi:MAG: apolipoprotein N-acyltransferase [Myxococcota bacterium]